MGENFTLRRFFLCSMHTIVVVSYAAVKKEEVEEEEVEERSFSLCTSIKFMLCTLPSTNITIERENYVFTVVKELLNIAHTTAGGSCSGFEKTWKEVTC